MSRRIWARMPCRWLTTVAISALAANAQVTSRAEAFRAEVRGLAGADAVELADGRRVRLQGITLPTAAVRPADFMSSLQARLRELLGREVWVSPSGEPAASGDLVGLVRPGPAAPSINQAVLAEGLALFRSDPNGRADLAALERAARAAQAARRGWFGREARPARELPYLNGAVIGLHYKLPELDYHRQLDELAAAGFRHVTFLISAFIENVRGSTIDRTRKQTVRDERLIETIGYAKSKGFSVLLLPIVLLLDAGEDEWRGTLRPKDEPSFWREYDRFLAHYLDIAQATSADAVSIGSELGALEDRTDEWRRILANARARFSGLLTYSVNWDHVDVPQFLNDLDFVGMTAYFSLTDEVDPTVDDLVAAWQRVAGELAEALARVHRPVVFTELGYCSQDGINRDPWNYVMNVDSIDLTEQADCFEAFLRVAPEMKFLRGAYWFDYFGDGGIDDHGYSPREKPAMVLWRKWAALRPEGVIRKT